MSMASVVGVILAIGFVSVALAAIVAWRQRMRESLPADDWRQAA